MGNTEKGIVGKAIHGKGCEGARAVGNIASWRFGSKACMGTQEERKLRRVGAGS